MASRRLLGANWLHYNQSKWIFVLQGAKMTDKQSGNFIQDYDSDESRLIIDENSGRDNNEDGREDVDKKDGE